MVDNKSNTEVDPDFLQFVSQLKAYKDAIKNKGVDKSQEMQKLKEQLKSQLNSQQIHSSIQDSESSLVSSHDSTPEETRESIAAQTMHFDPDAFSNLENSAFFTPHELNPSMGHSLESDELVEEGLENFIPNTDPNKFKSDEQVSTIFIINLCSPGSSPLSRWDAKARSGTRCSSEMPFT